MKNFAESNVTSAYEVGEKNLRIVKVAIDEALAESSEQLLLSLIKLGDRFSLHPVSHFPSTRSHVKLSSSSNK